MFDHNPHSAKLKLTLEALHKQAENIATFSLRHEFAQPNAAERVKQFTVQAPGLEIDYSKNLLNPEILRQLFNWFEYAQVAQKREAMLRGDKINSTENRSVLHTALRAPVDSSILVDGHNIVPDVHAVLDKMYAFADHVRNGTWLGATGKVITHIVNIGIGGSDLGPAMVSQALHAFKHDRLHISYVSNVDGADLFETLQELSPEQTLFVVCSKTFTTLETMTNAHIARNWALRSLVNESALAKHFVAVSTNAQAVSAFGIDVNNMFPFWDWVGGRYSVWSAIGLSVLLQIGKEAFTDFLAGAHAMDEHFRTAPLEQNAPCILALIGAWYNNFVGLHALNIAPYSHGLRRFAAYLQQLDMESNGKSVQINGANVDGNTSPIIWGEAGTNGQHAYFQCLHQGTSIIPIDFILPLKPSYPLDDSHRKLVANCFAQSQALAFGKTHHEVTAELAAHGFDTKTIQELTPHKVFEGNRPSNTILLNELSPYHLGSLIALYEHKVFVQGALWHLNSFDQWGVELGKVLASDILNAFNSGNVASLDASTAALVKRYKESH